MVPFNLKDGLPPELEPLLFDSARDASVISEDKTVLVQKESKSSHSAESHGGSDAKASQDVHGIAASKHDDKMMKEAEGSWTRESDMRDFGQIANRVYSVSDDHTFQVRIRAHALAPTTLARAKLPRDLLALVVVDVNDEHKDLRKRLATDPGRRSGNTTLWTLGYWRTPTASGLNRTPCVSSPSRILISIT